MIIKTIIHHTGFWTFFWRMLTPKASDTGALASFLGVGSLTTPKFLVPKFVASEYIPKKHDHKMEAVPKVVHPGRLTWNLQITHLERKMIFQTSMIMVHVNFPGCTYIGKLRQPIPQHEAKSYAIHLKLCILNAFPGAESCDKLQPWKMKRLEPKNHPIEPGKSSSNSPFSGSMLNLPGCHLLFPQKRDGNDMNCSILKLKTLTCRRQ